MNDSEINVAVAECCGWNYTPLKNVRLPGDNKHWHCEEAFWTDPSGDRCDEDSSPDYCSSRDAMASALETLSAAEHVQMLTNLYHDLIPRRRQHDDHFLDWGIVSLLFKATPKQLAIAFLKTKGKWRDA